MQKQIKHIIFLLMLLAVSSPMAYSHCQIPCGIYDDHAQVKSMLEDAATARKAIGKIAELSAKNNPQSNNQLIRWVMNKEKHAQNIISSISDYFLTQRVKSTQKDYSERFKETSHCYCCRYEGKTKCRYAICR